MNYAWSLSPGETGTKGSSRYASWGGGWESHPSPDRLKASKRSGNKRWKSTPPPSHTHAHAHTHRLTPHCTRLDLDLKRFNSLKWEREYFWAGFRSGSKQIRKPCHPPRPSSVPGSTFSWCGDDTGTRRWKSIEMARARRNGESVSHDPDPG